MLEKLPHEITALSEVKQFCDQKHPESRWLDYKREYKKDATRAENNKIAKIVSAMANTHGGWVMIGIEEEKDQLNRGVPGKIVGVKKDLRLGERIKQVCLDAIYPPVSPEIGTVEIDSDLEVVLVRIFESDSAPHEIEGGKVYVRTNDIAYPIEDGKDATVKEIEFLLNKRTKAHALRQHLVARATDRCRQFPDRPQISFSCLPLFPDAPICNYQKLFEIYNGLRKFGCFVGTSRCVTAHECITESFPRPANTEIQTLRTTFEISLYGSIYYRTEHFTRREIKVGDNQGYGMDSVEALDLLYTLTQAADWTFKQLQFSGLVELNFGLHCEGGNAILTAPTSDGYLPNSDRLESVPSRNFSIRREVLTHRIQENSFIENIYREFLWSGGLGPYVWEWDRPKELVTQANQTFRK